jgi:predicted RND superfamily exporter protein
MLTRVEPAGSTATNANEEDEVMAANVGGIDRTLRIVVGIVVLALFFVLEGNARYWALVGFVPLLTGLFSVCPVYTLLGLNTCPMKKA